MASEFCPGALAHGTGLAYRYGRRFSWDRRGISDYMDETEKVESKAIKTGGAMDIGIIELRSEIDKIDNELINLFSARMRVAGDIARYKAQNALPVLDAGREQRKLDEILEKTDEDLREYMSALYSRIFELSRAYQERKM